MMQNLPYLHPDAFDNEKYFHTSSKDVLVTRYLDNQYSHFVDDYSSQLLLLISLFLGSGMS